MYRWGRDMFPITVSTLSQVPHGRKSAQIEVGGGTFDKQTMALRTRLVSTIAISQQLLAVASELQYETVLVAQPADVELIFEGLTVAFHSKSLCDFHWKIVMDAKRSHRIPVVLTITERASSLVVSVHRP